MASGDLASDLKQLLTGYSSIQAELASLKEQVIVLQQENFALREQLATSQKTASRLEELIGKYHNQVADEVRERGCTRCLAPAGPSLPLLLAATAAARWAVSSRSPSLARRPTPASCTRRPCSSWPPRWRRPAR